MTSETVVAVTTITAVVIVGDDDDDDDERRRLGVRFAVCGTKVDRDTGEVIRVFPSASEKLSAN